MDPNEGWEQNKGLQGLGKQYNNGKTGNLGLQKGELSKFSLYCLLFSQEDRHPRVRKAYSIREQHTVTSYLILYIMISLEIFCTR